MTNSTHNMKKRVYNLGFFYVVCYFPISINAASNTKKSLASFAFLFQNMICNNHEAEVYNASYINVGNHIIWYRVIANDASEFLMKTS